MKHRLRFGDLVPWLLSALLAVIAYDLRNELSVSEARHTEIGRFAMTNRLTAWSNYQATLRVEYLLTNQSTIK